MWLNYVEISQLFTWVLFIFLSTFFRILFPSFLFHLFFIFGAIFAVPHILSTHPSITSSNVFFPFTTFSVKSWINFCTFSRFFPNVVLVLNCCRFFCGLPGQSAVVAEDVVAVSTQFPLLNVNIVCSKNIKLEILSLQK